MKTFKNMLRLWISFTSVFGFFGAWAMLAQSFKSPQSQSMPPATAYPTLTALAPINVNFNAQANINLQVATLVPTPIPPPQPQPIFRQLLRTGGS